MGRGIEGTKILKFSDTAYQASPKWTEIVSLSGSSGLSVPPVLCPVNHPAASGRGILNCKERTNFFDIVDAFGHMKRAHL